MSWRGSWKGVRTLKGVREASLVEKAFVLDPESAIKGSENPRLGDPEVANSGSGR